MSALRSMTIRYSVALLLTMAGVVVALYAPEWFGSEHARARLTPDFDKTDLIILPRLYFAEHYPGPTLAQAALSTGAKLLVLNPPEEAPLKPQDLGLSEAEFGKVLQVKLGLENPWLKTYSPKILRYADKLGMVLGQYPGATPETEAQSLSLAKNLGMELRPIELYLDGANLITEGQRCVLSAPLRGAPLYKGDQSGAHTKEDYAEKLKTDFHCQSVIFIQDPPFEHVSKYAQFVRHDEVFVGQLSSQTLELLRDEEDLIPVEMQELKERLDRVAEQLSVFYKVKRIPQPLPFRGAEPSYLTAILVNQVALVPQFKTYGFAYDQYPDQSLFGQYEESVKLLYESAGYKVVFCQADALTYNGGALNFGTLLLPKIQR